MVYVILATLFLSHKPFCPFFWRQERMSFWSLPLLLLHTLSQKQFIGTILQKSDTLTEANTLRVGCFLCLHSALLRTRSTSTSTCTGQIFHPRKHNFLTSWKIFRLQLSPPGRWTRFSPQRHSNARTEARSPPPWTGSVRMLGANNWFECHF